MKENKKPRICLFVDGSNLYAGQYELFGPKKYLSFSEFVKQAEEKLKIVFTQIYFYASYSPTPKKPTKKQKEYLKNEALFYKNVKRTKNVIFFKGYRSKTSGKEKEVDVKLSVDLVGMGLLGKYEQAYLISGDADFLQAIFFVKKHYPQKIIGLICLNNKIMYKGLYYLPSWVVEFEKKVVRPRKIARKTKIIYIKKTAELCPRLS